MVRKLEALMDMIQKHPCLCNKQTSPVYVWQEIAKEKAWEEIAKEMKLSVDTCKEIWIIIQDVISLSSKLDLNKHDKREFVFSVMELIDRTKDTGHFSPPPIVETETDKTKEQNGLKMKKDTRETLPSTQEDHLMSPRRNERVKPCSNQVDNVCVNCSQQKTNGSPADDYRKSFLISLLPDVNKLSDNEMRDFKVKVLMLLDEMLTGSQHDERIK